MGLVLPPAWTEVWVCPDADGQLQAVGTDDAGRRQYLYHPDWRTKRDENSNIEKILDLGPASVMAFVAETVVGATLGAVPPVADYFKRIRATCDRHGVLLMDSSEHPAASERATFAADGFHPSPEGHRRAAAEFLLALRKRLRRAA